MAVARQKRKTLEDTPPAFLERDGSCASAMSDTNMFGRDKRRRTDLDASVSEQDHAPQGPASTAYFFGTPQHPQASPLLDHNMSSPPHPSSSLAGSSACGFAYMLDSAASPQPSTSGQPQGWAMGDARPAGSFASAESYQYSSSIGDQHDAAMQAETPHSQALQIPRYNFQPSLSLQRSNSAPDLRVLLSGAVNPVPQAVLHQGCPPFGSSSTAGALVPYKAPEGHMLF